MAKAVCADKQTLKWVSGDKTYSVPTVFDCLMFAEKLLNNKEEFELTLGSKGLVLPNIEKLLK